jgi:hypothetical protein
MKPRRTPVWLRTAYAFFAAVAVGIGTATYLEPQSHFLSTFGSNLAPDALGILIGLLLVERIVKLQRDRELEPLRLRATQMIALPISFLVKLLAEMYKASSDPPISPGSGLEVPFETADELVDGWRNAVLRFNVMAPAPSPNQNATWGEYIGHWSNNITAGIEGVLDRYTEAVGIDAVTAIEDVINGGDFRLWFRDAAVTVMSGRQTGHSRPVHLPFGSPDQMTVEALDDLAVKLKELFRLFGDETGAYKVPTVLWTHMQPHWASARYDGQIAQSMVVMRTQVLPRSPSPEDMAEADIDVRAFDS